MSGMTVQLGDLDFSGVAPIEEWAAPGGECLFAAMVRPDPEKRPADFKVVYFGESANLSSTDQLRENPKFRCWVSEAGSLSNLFIGTIAVPGVDEDTRKRWVRGLCDQYHPICNW
ncbi:MAG: hypothetical protein CNCCGFBP_02037 [Fimbriimonadaceae bacterium]|nr:hypothetical protein [Fimbriimonadaceae bacterium]